MLRKGPEANIPILFVGNSHTQFHNLPELVCDMLRFRHPQRNVQARFIWVTFLEDAAKNPEFCKAIESGQWDYLVLQAQKISQSGRFHYSTKEGSETARLGKKHGAAVFFYSEWGVKGIPDHTERIEKIYREMATASGSLVIPVGRAWELALATRPDIPLHDTDGNHQTALGAFLTACVLTSWISKENPSPLAAFPYAKVKEADRKFLASIAARAYMKRL